DWSSDVCSSDLVQSSRFEVQGSPCTRQRLTVAGSEQSFSTNQDRVAGLTIPAELIAWNPSSAPPGNLGLERQFAVYHGLGKGWRLAPPRLLPLPGGRAGPLLGFPVAKRVKSGASNSVNSGNLLLLALRFVFRRPSSTAAR